MARTNKKKQRENKKRASSISVSKKFSNPRTKLSLEDAKAMGVVTPHINPDGNTYHWFVRGRKACYETKIKYDPDGYRFYKGKQGDRLCVDMKPLSGYVKKRLVSSTK